MKNILVSGAPGSGKTTLVRTVAERLHNLAPAGFYTAEIRVSGIRQGFELVSFSGGRRILSHVTIRSPYRVGKYGVDVAGFEDFLAALPVADSPCALYIIDEIGKMETLSFLFCTLVDDVLASDIPCIATIAQRGNRWIEAIKHRNDVEVMTVDSKNRTVLADLITARVNEIVHGKRSGSEYYSVQKD